MSSCDRENAETNAKRIMTVESLLPYRHYAAARGQTERRPPKITSHVVPSGSADAAEKLHFTFYGAG